MGLGFRISGLGCGSRLFVSATGKGGREAEGQRGCGAEELKRYGEAEAETETAAEARAGAKAEAEASDKAERPRG